MEVSFRIQSYFLYNNAHIIMLHTSLSEQSRRNNLSTSNVDTSTTVLNVDKQWTDNLQCVSISLFLSFFSFFIVLLVVLLTKFYFIHLLYIHV